MSSEKIYDNDIKMSEEYLRKTLGLDTDRPNDYQVTRLIVGMFHNTTSSFKSFSLFAAYERVLNDKKVKEVAERYGMLDQLEEARNRATRERLLTGALSDKKPLVEQSLNEMLDHKDRQSMMLTLSGKLTLIPDAIVDRLIELKDNMIDFAICGRVYTLSDKYLQYVIDEKDLLCYSALFMEEKCIPSGAGQMLQNMVKDFSDDDIKVVLPCVAHYCNIMEDWHNVFDSDLTPAFGPLCDFHDRCSQIKDLSPLLMENLSRIESFIDDFGRFYDAPEIEH